MAHARSGSSHGTVKEEWRRDLLAFFVRSSKRVEASNDVLAAATSKPRTRDVG